MSGYVGGGSGGLDGSGGSGGSGGSLGARPFHGVGLGVGQLSPVSEQQAAAAAVGRPPPDSPTRMVREST